MTATQDVEQASLPQTAWICVADRALEGQGRQAVRALRADEINDDLRLVVADAEDVCRKHHNATRNAFRRMVLKPLTVLACLGLGCLYSPNALRAEIIVEWGTLPATSRLGGQILERRFVQHAGTTERAERSYNQFRNALGTTPNSFSARGEALRCRSSEGLGWYGYIVSARQKETNQSINGLYARWPEGGTSVATCGVASADGALELLLRACEREALCSSFPEFSLALQFDDGVEPSVPAFFCDSKVSFSDLLNTCRAQMTQRSQALQTLAAPMAAASAANLPKKYRLAVVPPGERPVIDSTDGVNPGIGGGKSVRQAAASDSPPAGGDFRYFVQVATLDDRSAANRSVEVLRSRGFAATIDAAHSGLLRVRIGPYPEKDSAQRALNDLRASDRSTYATAAIVRIALDPTAAEPLPDVSSPRGPDPHARTIYPDGYPSLDAMLERLRSRRQDVEVMFLVGHTDNRRTKAKADALSLQRAESVKRYLVDRGIDPAKLFAEGKGFADPADDNGTAAGRARNNRVDIELVGRDAKNAKFFESITLVFSN